MSLQKHFDTNIILHKFGVIHKKVGHSKCTHSAERKEHSVFSIVKRKSRVVRGNHKTLNAKCRVRGLLGRIFILGKAYHFFKKRKVFI